MAFEDMDLDDNDFDLEAEDSSAPEDSGNRTFYIVAGVIGGVMLLSLICLALYALVYAPQKRNQQATQVAAINAQNTQVAQAAVETGLAAKFTATPTRTPIPPTATASPSPTLVIALHPNTGTGNSDHRSNCHCVCLIDGGSSWKRNPNTNCLQPYRIRDLLKMLEFPQWLAWLCY